MACGNGAIRKVHATWTLPNISKVNGNRSVTPQYLHALLALTTRPPSNPLIQVLPLPRQALLDQLLLLLAVRAKILDEGLGLLGGAFPHLADLLLEASAASVHPFPQKTLLHVAPDQQPLDLILVKLAPPRQGLLEGGVGLCDPERKVRDGLLHGMGSTT